MATIEERKRKREERRKAREEKKQSNALATEKIKQADASLKLSQQNKKSEGKTKKKQARLDKKKKKEEIKESDARATELIKQADDSLKESKKNKRKNQGVNNQSQGLPDGGAIKSVASNPKESEFMGFSAEEEKKIRSYAKENNVSLTEASQAVFPMGDVFKDNKSVGAAIKNVVKSPITGKDLNVNTVYDKIGKNEGDDNRVKVIGTEEGQGQPGNPGNIVTNNIINDTESVNEADGAGGDGEEINKVINKADNEINNNVEKNKEDTKLQIDNIGDVASKGTGSYSLTEEDYLRASNEFKAASAAAKSRVPQDVVEKLNYQDYYPPQQDYMKAGFTGRYIGSRDIIVGTGALFPQGVLDARKRAMAAGAKAKKKQQEKFWKIKNTAPQYDEQYKDVGMDMLTKYFDLAGGDIDGLLSGSSKLSQMFRRDLFDFESRGKNMKSINSSIKSLIKAANTGKTYISDKALTEMEKFKSATLDLDAFMKGEAIGDKKVEKLRDFLVSYQNFTPLANEQLKILKEAGADKKFLKFNSDLSAPEFAANLSEALSKTSGSSYDEFRSVMLEFYDVDAVEDVVTSLYDNNNLYEGDDRERQIQEGVRYMMAVLPEKIDLEEAYQKNDKLGWSNLNFKKKALKTITEYNNLWAQVQKEMVVGKGNVVSIVKNVGKGNRSQSIANLYTQNKLGKPVSYGGLILSSLPTSGDETIKAPSSQLMVINDNGDMVSTNTYANSLNTKMDNMTDKNSQAYKDLKEKYNEVSKVSNSKDNYQVNVSGRFSGYGVLDKNSNTMNPIDNVSQSNISQDDILELGYQSGSIGIETGVDDSGKMQIKSSVNTYVNVENISSESTQRAMLQERRQEGADSKEGLIQSIIGSN
jgi:hypothetical protein